MKLFIYIKERSTRLPGKNFMVLPNGEPLWKHTMLAFAGWDIFVDTDSEAILCDLKADARLAHVTGYLRAPEHSRSEGMGLSNPVVDMTDRFIAERVTDPDEPLAVTHVTSPFIKPDTIRRGMKQMQDVGYDSVLSVDVIQNHMFRRGGGDPEFIPVNFDSRFIPRTQDLEPIFILNHAFYAFTARSFGKWHGRIGEKPLLSPLEWPENVDIDTERDWRVMLAVWQSCYGSGSSG